MITVRALIEEDIPRIEEIHGKHYAHEFELPNFYKDYVCAFAITENNDIIIIGGVRLIPEVVLMTDKNFPAKERREALMQAMNISEFLTKKAGYDKVHAVSEDEKWLTHLINAGFQARGKIVVLHLD